MLDKSVIPRSECLKDTVERVLPYWYDVIVPAIKVCNENSQLVFALFLPLTKSTKTVRLFLAKSE